MAKQQAEKQKDTNGHDEEVARFEHELAEYLQERIKPGLNRGAIPLLARSIAKDIAHREHPNGTAEEAEVDEEPAGEAEEEPRSESEGEPQAESGDEPDVESDDAPDAESEDEPEAESDDEPEAESDDETDAEAEDEPGGEADEDADDEQSESAGSSDFEADMHDLQEELGEDWILRFSVQGDDAWLTAEKDDGSQRVEAPTASVLSDAVAVLNKGGGRSS